MSQSPVVQPNPDVPVSSSEMIREICSTVHELSRKLASASTHAETALSAQNPAAGLLSLRLNLASLGESVTRLRWLSMALVSAQLEIVESPLDLNVLVKECLAHVRPPLPTRCDCTCFVQPGLVVHADLTLLVEAFSLLLNAASLRLGQQHHSAAPLKLFLSVRRHVGKTVVRLAYSAPRHARLEADGHEQLALKVFKSLGGSASLRGSRRWSVIHVRLPSAAAATGA